MLLDKITSTVFIRINAPSLLVIPSLLSTFEKFIFQGFTSLSTAITFAIPGFPKKMHFSTSPIEYRLREIKKVTTRQSSYDHKRNEICKNKLNNFFKFKVCFQYFKLSHHYTCWQARSRRVHYHPLPLDSRVDFFIGNSRPPSPPHFLKMHCPRGVYTNKYGKSNQLRLLCYLSLFPSLIPFDANIIYT